MSVETNRTNIAVIPARGGSKRIPGKNIRTLCGKPLISHTIEAARQSNLFERIVVTTDSPEIADIARHNRAEVPFLRTANLSDDFTPVSAVTVDVLRRLDPGEKMFRNVCQLMPNCPLRTEREILASYCQFIETKAQSQISVVRYGWQNPWWAMRRGEDFALDPVFKDAITRRSQDLPELFCPTGAIWWAQAGFLRHEGTFHAPGRTGWEIPWQRGLDIDTEDDWAMAELLMCLGSKQ